MSNRLSASFRLAMEWLQGSDGARVAESIALSDSLWLVNEGGVWHTLNRHTFRAMVRRKIIVPAERDRTCQRWRLADAYRVDGAS